MAMLGQKDCLYAADFYDTLTMELMKGGCEETYVEQKWQNGSTRSNSLFLHCKYHLILQNCGMSWQPYSKIQGCLLKMRIFCTFISELENTSVYSVSTNGKTTEHIFNHRIRVLTMETRSILSMALI